jgi:hypothetical protein
MSAERERRTCRLEAKQELVSLFDVIDPASSGDDLKIRVGVIAKLLSPEDPESRSPLVRLADEVEMVLSVETPQPLSNNLEAIPDPRPASASVSVSAVSNASGSFPFTYPDLAAAAAPQDVPTDSETNESKAPSLRCEIEEAQDTDDAVSFESQSSSIPSFVERLHHCFADKIPLAILLQDLPPPLLEPLIPNIVFYGSQEHGTTLLMEHLIQFPLPQRQNLHVEVFLRPDELKLCPDANAVDRIEILDENRCLLSDLCVRIGAVHVSDVDQLYCDLYDRVVEIAQQRDQKTSPASFTLRVCLYSPKWPLLNLLYFPFLYGSQEVGQYISDRNRDSYFCFVVSSNVSIRSAEVSTHLIRRCKEVSDLTSLRPLTALFSLLEM